MPRETISIVSPVASPQSERGRREEDEAGEEHALAPDQVAGAPAEQEEAAEEQRVGVDDPLQARLGEAEVGLDRRQRDVHDRRVEDHHELREADEDEDEPGVDAVCARVHESDGSGCVRTDGVRLPAPRPLGSRAWS